MATPEEVIEKEKLVGDPNVRGSVVRSRLETVLA